jgi:cytidine deaminase
MQTVLTLESMHTLLKAAEAAAAKAYAPYSHFPVGAALLLANGTLLQGCNVENASYGLTLCAERNVLAQWVAQGQAAPAVAVGLWAAKPAGHHLSPCGACRQVLAELLPAETPVVMMPHPAAEGTARTAPVVQTVAQLLPSAFRLP